jgi:hypothetical protein
MISFVLLLLIGGCFATPIQQGGIRIYQYTAGKEGINTQNDGSRPLPQPIIWNQDQPIIVEPAPLTYGSVKGGSLITERDQQRHLNIDEEIESREEVSAEETKPDSEVNLDSRDVVKVDDQRPVQTETAALLGSSILPLKGGVKQIVSLDNEQVFPQVVSGQRRLVETQPQQYSVKGKSLNTISGASPSVDNVGYQALHYGIPISVEEHRVTSQGVKRPVVQYQLQPAVNQEVTREVVRRPTYQVVQQSVKGVPRQVHYVIQPIIPSSINYVSRQPVQSVNRVQVLSQSEGKQIENLVRQTQDETQGAINRDVDLRPIQLGQGTGEALRPEDLLQKQGVKTLVQLSNQKINRDETVRHVPVISGQRVVGYQLVSTQPQTQYQTLVPSEQSLVSNQQVVYTQNGQQYVPYVIQQQIPQTDVQQYYQTHQVQSYGQQDDNQFNPYISQQIPYVQPIQYSESNLPRVEQPVRTISQTHHGLQGVQQIQTDRVVNRGQDLRVNPLPVNQRSTVVTGVKGAVNV